MLAAPSVSSSLRAAEDLDRLLVESERVRVATLRVVEATQDLRGLGRLLVRVAEDARIPLLRFDQDRLGVREPAARSEEAPEVDPGDERVGVVRAPHAEPDFERFAIERFRFVQAPELVQHHGEAVHRHDRAALVAAGDPRADGEHVLQDLCRLLVSVQHAQRVRVVASHSEHQLALGARGPLGGRDGAGVRLGRRLGITALRLEVTQVAEASREHLRRLAAGGLAEREGRPDVRLGLVEEPEREVRRAEHVVHRGRDLGTVAERLLDFGARAREDVGHLRLPAQLADVRGVQHAELEIADRFRLRFALLRRGALLALGLRERLRLLALDLLATAGLDRLVALLARRRCACHAKPDDAEQRARRATAAAAATDALLRRTNFRRR